MRQSSPAMRATPIRCSHNQEVQRLIDFRRPVGVLMVALLHFIPDDADAFQVGASAARIRIRTRQLHRHLARQKRGKADRERVAHANLRPHLDAEIMMRSHQAIERLFDGLHLVEPGVCYLPSLADGIRPMRWTSILNGLPVSPARLSNSNNSKPTHTFPYYACACQYQGDMGAHPKKGPGFA